MHLNLSRRSVPIRLRIRIGYRAKGPARGQRPEVTSALVRVQIGPADPSCRCDPAPAPTLTVSPILHNVFTALHAKTFLGRNAPS